MDYKKHNDIIKFYSGNLLEGKGEDGYEVNCFFDEKEQSEVLIIETVGNHPNIVYYGSAGTFSHCINRRFNNKPVSVEFIGVGRKIYSLYPNIMSTCCFNIINSDYDCYPGVVYPDVVKMYYHDTNMKHILLVRPFSWDYDFYLEMDDRIITWLEMLPISDSELEYITEKGCEAFEDILEESEVDILDLNRPSVV